MRATHPSSIFIVYSFVSNGKGLFKGALSTKLVLDIGSVRVFPPLLGAGVTAGGRAGSKHGLGQEVKDGLTPSNCRGSAQVLFQIK